MTSSYLVRKEEISQKTTYQRTSQSGNEQDGEDDTADTRYNAGGVIEELEDGNVVGTLTNNDGNQDTGKIS